MAEKPKLRWFQISLRTLLLVTLVVGGGLGWKLRRVHLRKALIHEVQKRGGSVAYLSSGSFSDDSVPRDNFDLFGDAPVKAFHLPIDVFGETDVKHLQEAFPEATVEPIGPAMPLEPAPD